MEALNAPPGHTLRASFVPDLARSPDRGIHDSMPGLAPAADATRRKVCLGDAAARARHQARLANRAMPRAAR